MLVGNNIRGGISIISRRYAKANNEFLQDKEEYDQTKQESHIMYYDAKALYSCAMSKPLPTGNFGFLSQNEISRFDVTVIPEYSHFGYILDVDLNYLEGSHNLHSSYPLAPDRVKINKSMLSPYCLQFIDTVQQRI